MGESHYNFIYFYSDFYFSHYSLFAAFCQFSTVQQGDPVTHTWTGDLGLMEGNYCLWNA